MRFEGIIQSISLYGDNVFGNPNFVRVFKGIFSFNVRAVYGIYGDLAGKISGS